MSVKASLHSDIMRLAIPNVLTNLTVPLLGMVDMHLMGYQNSELFMGAVALGSVIFNIVYWGFAFLRMSTSGMAAQAFGRDKTVDMAMVLFRGMAIVFIGVCVLLVTQSGILKLSLSLLDGSSEVKHLASQYFYIRIWSAPAAIALMVINGWFLGMQNAWYPMLIAVVINGVNILTSFFLVKYMGMKVEGVALGSVVAEYVGLVLAGLLFLKKYANVLTFFSLKELFRWHALTEFLNVSGDIFVRTMCVIVVFTFFTSQSAGTSNVILAANSALLQFLFLFAYFLDGFAYAAEALVGKYVGGRNVSMLSRTVKALFLWGVSMAFLFTMMFWIGGDWLLKVFTNQQDVIAEGRRYLSWLIILPLTGFASFIWDGIYIGATASKLMRNTMLLATLFFFLLFFSLRDQLGNHALWLAMNVFMLARGLSQSVLYRYLPVFRKSFSLT